MQRVLNQNLISHSRFIGRRAISIFHSTSYQSFNVQDQEDFKKRVLEATTPVIVDFHAKYVVIHKLRIFY